MWDEVRAAAEVVRRGTVSAAAEALGIHRATVQRRIDTLETELGGKLFQRHARGYTPTELGRDVVRIAEDAGAHFERLRRRALSEEDIPSGELIVTSIDEMAPRILKMIADFSAVYPKIKVSFHGSHEMLSLETGEAHVALRVGPRPQEPDYVVLPYPPVQVGLYGSRTYIQRYGKPEPGRLHLHRYVLPKGSPAADQAERWLHALVPEADVVPVGNSGRVTEAAIMAGVGLGFLVKCIASEDPTLVEAYPSDPSWCKDAWIVTHVDLHRSAKVQAFLDFCRP